jgi:hypothetical protein
MSITRPPIRRDQSISIKPMACNLPFPYGFGEFDNDGDDDVINQAIALRKCGYARSQIAKTLGLSTPQVWHYTRDVKPNK